MKIIYPDGGDHDIWDVVSEKGVIGPLRVILPDNRSIELEIFTPERLAVEMALLSAQDIHWIGNPGLIVVDRIDKITVERAIAEYVSALS